MNFLFPDKLWNYKNFNMVTELDIAGEFIYDGVHMLNQIEVINQGFSVTRKYIFQLGGIAPFKGYAVFSCLSVSFCSVCGSVGKWISPTKLKTISTF